MIALEHVTVVVLAKRPDPGRVKTRLVRAGWCDDVAAARLGRAMLRCTLSRLDEFGQIVLAVSPDGCGPSLVEDLQCPGITARLPGTRGTPGITIVDQGPGELGTRLDHLWRTVRPDGPLAFLGMDSPDIPAEALAAIGPALDRGDLVLGPTEDGGFWTLAGRRHRGLLLGGIDWGGPAVYDQVRSRAATAGLSVATLPAWRDVDEPDDVGALRRRLIDRLRGASSDAQSEPLRGLAEEVEAAWARWAPGAP